MRRGIYQSNCEAYHTAYLRLYCFVVVSTAWGKDETCAGDVEYRACLTTDCPVLLLLETIIIYVHMYVYIYIYIYIVHFGTNNRTDS
jgi:hypothetical protein